MTASGWGPGPWDRGGSPHREREHTRSGPKHLAP